MKVTAILLAAGSGERLGLKLPKAFVNFNGKPLLLASLQALQQHSEVNSIVVVSPTSHLSTTKKLVKDFSKVSAVVSGGETRLNSLINGLKKVKSANFILTHNAANPNVSAQEISQTIAAAQKFSAAGVGISAASTVKKIQKGKIISTLPREEIFLMETPQVVKFSILRQGIQLAQKNKITITDDIQLAEILGISPAVIPASSANRKITTQADLLALQNFENRVGLGLDSHPFASRKRNLILAGVKLSSNGGLAGNSDGDVIIHSLINALSSALGGGSISTYADSLCQKGIKDSRKYLEKVLEKLTKENCEIVNVSVALEAAKPKLEKHFPKLKNSLSKLLSISADCIGITATTGEGLTSFGRGEGIQCFVIVLLRQCR
ncbi:MAG: 2-C-methyl-D-erythritol 4-phosphate cytidylyltransferase [Candidatus Gracilibacteria bacterium]|jgi:2-C-methyl-D-erythritol 4-phosphate cytidylyltransferase/2-C-methyl-D-erythritol 2,4-cyclodiphosphate synthase|nr:2-C-methyl-D-erythritol 4-phosphate cytidylyltransferase [Candidatus Gracilibacteria bacterium]MDD5178660.1 2-C-methyl-D-erythritol 4-phosphate cytidylyltransferase [Candidatus Gracilibacteria bacterium]